MTIVSSYSDSEPFSEDQTLLTLYSLAGEESGGFVAFRPRLFHQIGKVILPGTAVPSGGMDIGPVTVRELTSGELDRAAREIWVHYHQQKADPRNDRVFAAFSGPKLIGVARASRHPDGLEVDAVYILEDYRKRGFARAAMNLLITECGRNETLFMHSKLELVDFYGSLGFYPVTEEELPKTIRDRFGFCLGNLKGIDVCPMRRDPAGIAGERNT